MNWINSLDNATNLFVEHFKHLPLKTLNIKPSANQWCIAEVLNHLIQANGTYHSAFDKILKGEHNTPFLGKIPFYPEIMGSMLLAAVSENRKIKSKTVPVFEPVQSSFDETIWEDFFQSQEILKDYIDKFSSQNLKEVITSPAAKFVVYRLKKALDIICTHEHRHFNQAQDVLTMIKGPK